MSNSELRYSENTSFRLILGGPQEGRWNMAVDEALLEAVSAGESPPVIRLYGFEPATLSVGRFQPTKEKVDFSLLEKEGLTFVRRPTGGQSVLHTEELTYAFVVGKGHLEPFGKRWVYRFIAPLLMGGLARLGVSGIRASAAQRGDPRNPDCFGSTGEYEIDSRAGRKLVGSAQMVTRTAVLQHGSIPLSARGRAIVRYLRLEEQQSTDHASNVAEELGRPVTFEDALAGFHAHLGERLPVEVGELKAEESRRAHELLNEKYATDQWNRKY